MRLNELVADQKILVQINLGEQTIEFYADILKVQGEGIDTTPYIHNDEVLELNIETHHGVVCNIFAENPSNKKRVSWKNVKIHTIDSDNSENGKIYHISTSTFNRHSREDDNRQHNRLIIHKNAHILDQGKLTDIVVHDISDSGISFFVSPSYKPSSNQLTIVYTDSVDEKNFQLKLECQIARTERKAGVVFYGCKVMGDNKDFLTYGFLKRIKKHHHEKK